MPKDFNRIMTLLAVFTLATATTAGAKHQSKDEEKAANVGASVQAAQLRCPKCQNAMEVGFALENQGSDYPYTYTSWVNGPIKQSYRTADVKSMLPIRTFRCTNCGYLEMYAK